jgi:hypothetical protein
VTWTDILQESPGRWEARRIARRLEEYVSPRPAPRVSTIVQKLAAAINGAQITDAEMALGHDLTIPARRILAELGAPSTDPADHEDSCVFMYGNITYPCRCKPRSAT